MNTLLITSVRNEGPWLLEWVAYHKAIGFSDIVIYQNDSDDRTSEILQRLDRLEVIHFCDNTDFKGKPQLSACRKATEMEVYKKSDWCLFIDGDEYFVPNHCATVEAFLGGFPNAVAIAINWLNFGSSGHAEWSPGLTTDRFVRCAATSEIVNCHIKSFHRPAGGFSGFGIHRPWPRQPSPRFIYADGLIVPDEIQMGGNPFEVANVHIDHSVAQLNHYSIRSWEEFVRKVARGDGFHPHRPIPVAKFKTFDTNATTNHSIQRMMKSFRAAYLELQADETLMGLHIDSCRIHFSEERPSGPLS